MSDNDDGTLRVLPGGRDSDEDCFEAGEVIADLMLSNQRLQVDVERLKRREKKRNMIAWRRAIACALIASVSTWSVAHATAATDAATSGGLVTSDSCRPQHLVDCKRAVRWWKKIARQSRDAIQWQKQERRHLRRMILGGDNTALGQQLASMHGWTGSQWVCLQRLWSRESGWDEHGGSLSRAYGIPQALPGSKMASAGADWRDNPATQIRWGLGYIEARYGTPCAAYSHSNSYNFY